MHLIFCYVAALAIAALFYLWRDCRHLQSRRERRLRERVTYMLWIMAERMDSPSRPVPALRS
jgi:hypothetical protein